MGFMRKALIIGTGGLAPVKARSHRERTANAAEKQLRLQERALAGTQPVTMSTAVWNVTCPYCYWPVQVPLGEGVRCPRPKCGQPMSVRRGAIKTYARRLDQRDKEDQRAAEQESKHPASIPALQRWKLGQAAPPIADLPPAEPAGD